MATHSGDSPINRFFSFWGAIFTFLIFGLIALVLAGLETSLLSSAGTHPDDLRRTALDTETLATQEKLLQQWKKNDDGTYEVPVSFALPTMKDKLAKPSKSEVPVPGTAAAEAAAAAAMEAMPTEEGAPADQEGAPADQEGAPADQEGTPAGNAGQGAAQAPTTPENE